MDEIKTVHQCLFCSQTFDSASDKDDHILEHFAQETCTDCNQNLIRIGGYLYTRHNEATCIKKVPTSEEHGESCTPIGSIPMILETDNLLYEEDNVATMSLTLDTYESNLPEIKSEPIDKEYNMDEQLLYEQEKNKEQGRVQGQIQEEQGPATTFDHNEIDTQAVEYILPNNDEPSAFDIKIEAVPIPNDESDDLNTGDSEQNYEFIKVEELMIESHMDSDLQDQLQQAEVETLFQPKKRICRPQAHKKTIAKEKVERGVEHVTRSGNVKKGKVFEAQTKCRCMKRLCPTKIDVVRQREIFDTFYQNSNWSKKTLFLRASVKASPVASRKSDLFPLIPSKNRNFNCSYSLVDNDGISVEVCRDFFVKCLQVTPSRVYRAINSTNQNPTGIENRGRSTPKRKTSGQQKKWIVDFIDQFPKYESHYGHKQTNRKFLSPTLNVIKLYREFKRVMEFRQIKKEQIPKENIFRSTFNTEFNLSFKKWHTDTCKTCDELKAKFHNRITSAAKKIELGKEKEIHLSLVRKTNASFRDDVEAATESNGKIAVLMFDFQKTLETPSLSTSVAFYKRQLWTYNLCIFNEITKKGYMYVWSENVASRGGQEVGSCLLKYFNDHLSKETTKIILYSDSCGGQNRNIELALFLKRFLSENSTVETIEQKFFVSGHSHNSCDRCFTQIDKHKRLVGDVYTPDDWIKVIVESKVSEPKFHVTKMLPEDFLSSNNLEELIVNREKDVSEAKINWFGFRKIQYLKNDFFHIIAEENGVWKHINIRKKGIDETTFREIPMECLYPNGKEISQNKYDDLMYLLKFIPSKHHSFYVNLNPSGDAIDFGLASDSEAYDSDNDDVILIEES